MAETTPAAKHLKRAIETWVSSDDDGTELEQALDDAGVRAAVDAFEWINGYTWASPRVKARCRRALAALNGTKEGSDG